MNHLQKHYVGIFWLALIILAIPFGLIFAHKTEEYINKPEPLTSREIFDECFSEYEDKEELADEMKTKQGSDIILKETRQEAGVRCASKSLDYPGVLYYMVKRTREGRIFGTN